MSASVVTGRLWRDNRFLRLWFGTTVSDAGTYLSIFVLPTIAITLLHAGPFEVGLLTAAEFLAPPFVGVAAGGFVDRHPTRLVAVVTDFARVATLVSIPVTFGAHALTLWQLYAVALVNGALNTFHAAGMQRFFPSLVRRDDMVEASIKMNASQAVGEFSGPSLAGVLISRVGAPLAIVADAISYMVSGLMVLSVRAPASATPTPSFGAAANWRSDAALGIGFIRTSPMLWRSLLATALINVGFQMTMANWLVFAYGRLGQTPGAVGLLTGLGELGAFFGILLAMPVARQIGTAGMFLVISFTCSLSRVLIPLALLGNPRMVIFASMFAAGLSFSLLLLMLGTLWRCLVPTEMLGRVFSAQTVVLSASIPLGLLVGGVLGSTVGVLPTLIAGAAVTPLSALVWFGVPLRRMYEPQADDFVDLAPESGPVVVSVIADPADALRWF